MRISESFAKMRLSEYCSSQDIDRAIAVTVDSFVSSQKVSCKRALARAFAKYVLRANLLKGGLLTCAGIRWRGLVHNVRDGNEVEILLDQRVGGQWLWKLNTLRLEGYLSTLWWVGSRSEEDHAYARLFGVGSANPVSFAHPLFESLNGFPNDSFLTAVLQLQLVRCTSPAPRILLQPMVFQHSVYALNSVFYPHRYRTCD